MANLLRAGLLERIRRQLLATVDPAYREGQQNYFKETIRSHGVRAPEIKRIAAGAYRDWRTWSKAERELLESLRDKARGLGANAVVGLEVTLDPFALSEKGTTGLRLHAVGTAAKLEPLF